MIIPPISQFTHHTVARGRMNKQFQISIKQHSLNHLNVHAATESDSIRQREKINMTIDIHLEERGLFLFWRRPKITETWVVVGTQTWPRPNLSAFDLPLTHYHIHILFPLSGTFAYICVPLYQYAWLANAPLPCCFVCTIHAYANGNQYWAVSTRDNQSFTSLLSFLRNLVGRPISICILHLQTV